MLKKIFFFLFFFFLASICYGQEKILMSDSVGVFFDSEKEIKHYSNIPFYQLDTQTGVGVDTKQAEESKKRFIKYIELIHKNGYNSVSIDDLNHIVNMKEIFHSSSFLSQRNERYILYYRELIQIAKKQNIQVFIISDLPFYNDEVEKNIGDIEIKNEKLLDFQKKTIEQLFLDFPDLGGVIFRIGEGGKAYNNNEYKSKIVYKTPLSVNHFLKQILPLFEQYNKKLIFRTWSIGIGEIGDIMLNKKTYDQTFDGIDSPNFIVSIKHTPGDFFSFENINSTVGYGKWRQIIEIQTRKEYEGGGDFVNYFAQDYGKIFSEIQKYPNIIGVWNWNQTGGWGWGNNILFNYGFDFWNQINFFSVGKILNGETDENKIISEILQKYDFNSDQTKVMEEILTSSREIIKKGFYINDFRIKDIRIGNIILPPLLRIWWDRTTTSLIILSIIYQNLDEKQRTINESFSLLEKQKNQINEWKNVMGNNELHQKIYESLLNRYYIFEINHLFKTEFLQYFQTGEKKYASEILPKIIQYKAFIKDKPYFYYHFDEIENFYKNDTILFHNYSFYIHFFSFFGLCIIVFSYAKRKKIGRKMYIFGSFLWIITLVTPIFFVGNKHIYWLFIVLNTFFLWMNIIFFLLLQLFFYFFYKISLYTKTKLFFPFLFYKLLLNISYLAFGEGRTILVWVSRKFFGKIILFLFVLLVLGEIIFIASEVFGEIFFWKMFGYVLFHNFLLIIIGGIFVGYFFSFFLIGIYSSNFYQKSKQKKILFMILFFLFLGYSFIIYQFDFSKHLLIKGVQNFVPKYFIDAGSDMKDFF